MSLIERRSPFGATSAAGAILVRQLREPVVVGLILVGLGTSTQLVLPADSVSWSLRPEQQTTSGTSVVLPERAGAAIAELRRLSGFTWDQLARLFNVSRRSLHFWASGKAMTPANEEHLQRVLNVLRKIDRGSADANRAALLAAHTSGVIPFDQLARGRYDAVVASLGQSQGVTRAALPPLTDNAKLARAPRSPEELVGALHERVHHDTGTARAGKSVRTGSGGGKN
jgi:transcriptional regulator with XRE-family HTH domain